MGQGPRKAYRALVASGVVKADSAQERAVEQLEALAEALRAYRPARAGLGLSKRPLRGLYIYGDVGRGKSMLMDLFFAAAPLKAKSRVHFHAFMLETHAAINAWRRLDEKEKAKAARALGLRSRGTQFDDPIPQAAARIARDAYLLCFDEFQVTDVADAMILGRLFSALIEAGVVVVATSNRHPDALYENGLNRQLFLPFIALIKDAMEVLHLDGPADYRLDLLKGVGVYHTPLGPEADRAMNRAWRELTQHERVTPVELLVQGRTLLIERAVRGVARLTFDELCARPLGAADYLALAEAFHTLLVDHIPRLGVEQRNEARRFVTLIDSLYEKRVKLICSADAAPGDLYPKGDGAFEFARTASRLSEMQSAEYMGLRHVG